MAKAKAPRELTAADFLDNPPEGDAGTLVPLDVPHPRQPGEVWGRVYVQLWDGVARDDWEVRTMELAAGRPDDDYALARNVSAELVAACVCDKDGVRLFKDAAAAQALGAKPGLGGVLRYLYERCATYNRVRWEDLQELRGKSAGA